MMFNFTDKEIVGWKTGEVCVCVCVCVCVLILFIFSLCLWIYKGKTEKTCSRILRNWGNCFEKGNTFWVGSMKTFQPFTTSGTPLKNFWERNKQFPPEAAYIFASFRSWRDLLWQEFCEEIGQYDASVMLVVARVFIYDCYCSVCFSWSFCGILFKKPGETCKFLGTWQWYSIVDYIIVPLLM